MPNDILPGSLSLLILNTLSHHGEMLRPGEIGKETAGSGYRSLLFLA